MATALSASGIETLIHYPTPPHLSGAYAGLGWVRGSLPIAEELSKTVLSLPMGPHLTIDQQRVVTDAAKNALLERRDHSRMAR